MKRIVIYIDDYLYQFVKNQMKKDDKYIRKMLIKSLKNDLLDYMKKIEDTLKQQRDDYKTLIEIIKEYKNHD